MTKEELKQEIIDVQFDIDQTRSAISKMKLEVMKLESLLLEYKIKKEKLIGAL